MNLDSSAQIYSISSNNCQCLPFTREKLDFSLKISSFMLRGRCWTWNNFYKVADIKTRMNFTFFCVVLLDKDNTLIWNWQLVFEIWPASLLTRIDEEQAPLREKKFKLIGRWFARRLFLQFLHRTFLKMENVNFAPRRSETELFQRVIFVSLHFSKQMKGNERRNKNSNSKLETKSHSLLFNPIGCRGALFTFYIIFLQT